MAAGVLGMAPAPLAALRSFVATQQQQQQQQQHQQQQQQQQQQQASASAGRGVPRMKVTLNYELSPSSSGSSPQQAGDCSGSDFSLASSQKRKADEGEPNKDLKKAKLETKALKAKRPGFTDDRYNETSYYIENGLRKVYPYYFTFTTFTKGRWVGEKILDVFAREFRAHPAEEYERCIKGGTLTVNYEKVDVDYKLKHNDLLANIVHRHETPVLAKRIRLVHVDEDIVALDKPCSLPVHPCGRYRHNTVVFILAKEYNLKNLRTIHRLDRLTSGLLLFGRSPKKARQMEHQIRNRQVAKEYVCRVEGDFPDEEITCTEPIEVVSYKIGVCKVSARGKECATTFKKLGFNQRTNTSVVLCKPHTGRMHQIRVHLQFLGFPVVNDPLYNHVVFGPNKGKGGLIGKADDELIRDLVNIHNAENWLGMDGDSDLSMFKPLARDLEEDKGDDDDGDVSREPSPCGSCEDNSGPACMSPGLHNNNNNTSALNNNSSNNSHAAMASLPSAGVSSGLVGTGANNHHHHNNNNNNKVTVATQTGHECPDLAFQQDKMSHDPHCYECKVRYRDPKPRDLIMYLHAWKFRGPDWSYETELPDWSKVDWCEPDD
ncbi:RNA pseudouridylate synthase domain-containing protein 2-like isoform X2 [Thrips palmi]|uniref:Pseudouridylate synthase RPUSD2 n=1 Tax=Thrips palmi TaxID=161013 RepID=A0A6P8ZH85_THRPL|nr:RNA pseudouridylate synthase domain-containing protein 2-like isoform X2 [Thrips palmi]